MVAAFLICLFYALAGVLYAPGLQSLTALVFISMSAAPLLLAAGRSFVAPAVQHPRPTALFFMIVFGLGFLNLVVIAVGLERDPLELLSFEGFVLTAAAATTNRYVDQGASGNPLLMALSLFLLYRVGASSDRLPRWQQLLAFVPVLLYTLLSTEKWPLFLAGAFYIAGMFSAFTERQALTRLVRVSAVFAVLGLILAGSAQFMRGFDGDVLEVPAMLLHYVLAPFPALGSWLIGNASDYCCSLGKFTFIGAANQLGIVHREAGVFTDNYVIYDLETNIYSSWRYLIQDFSVAGPVLINTCIALLYLRCQEQGFLAAGRVIRGLMVLSALFSLSVTPFVHNSVALATTLSLAYSAFYGRPTGPRTLRINHEQARTAGI